MDDLPERLLLLFLHPASIYDPPNLPHHSFSAVFSHRICPINSTIDKKQFKRRYCSHVSQIHNSLCKSLILVFLFLIVIHSGYIPGSFFSRSPHTFQLLFLCFSIFAFQIRFLSRNSLAAFHSLSVPVPGYPLVIFFYAIWGGVALFFRFLYNKHRK